MRSLLRAFIFCLLLPLVSWAAPRNVDLATLQGQLDVILAFGARHSGNFLTIQDEIGPLKALQAASSTLTVLRGVAHPSQIDTSPRVYQVEAGVEASFHYNEESVHKIREVLMKDAEAVKGLALRGVTEDYPLIKPVAKSWLRLLPFLYDGKGQSRDLSALPTELQNLTAPQLHALYFETTKLKLLPRRSGRLKAQRFTDCSWKKLHL